jgi:hypothetical protein
MKKIIRKEIYEQKKKENPRKKVWVRARVSLDVKSVATELNGLTLGEALDLIKKNYTEAAEDLGISVVDIVLKKDSSGYNTEYGAWRDETDEEYEKRIDWLTDCSVSNLRAHRDYKRRELKEKKAQLERLKKELGE